MKKWDISDCFQENLANSTKPMWKKEQDVWLVFRCIAGNMQIFSAQRAEKMKGRNRILLRQKTEAELFFLKLFSSCKYSIASLHSMRVQANLVLNTSSSIKRAMSTKILTTIPAGVFMLFPSSFSPWWKLMR